MDKDDRLMVENALHNLTRKTETGSVHTRRQDTNCEPYTSPRLNLARIFEDHELDFTDNCHKVVYKR